MSRTLIIQYRYGDPLVEIADLQEISADAGRQFKLKAGLSAKIKCPRISQFIKRHNKPVGVGNCLGHIEELEIGGSRVQRSERNGYIAHQVAEAVHDAVFNNCVVYFHLDVPQGI